MKRCELCSHIARIFCESDNASLCYDCDQNVHSSNFLFVKHSRTLLCHKCQSPTPWTASGLHLGRAATVCFSCVNVQEDGDTDDDSIESSEESNEENQVVPWWSDSSVPVAASSSKREGMDDSEVCQSVCQTIRASGETYGSKSANHGHD